MPQTSNSNQPPPFCIQLELAEGCNLQCSFCGIKGIREAGNNSRPYKFLSVAHATRIARRLAECRDLHKWNPRIEMAMHGEPTQNPDRVAIVAALRNHLPRAPLMMTSNGGGLLAGGVTKNVNELFQAGLNTLLLDDYQGVKICDKIRAGYSGPVPVFEYPKQTHANPHQRHPYNTRRIVFVEDISVATKGNHSVLNNHCGTGAPKNDKGVGLQCAKPFREMAIRWDGNVAFCCNDWRGVMKVGNAVETDLETLWQSAPFAAGRRRLMVGQRDFGACLGCDAKTYRNGLLPANGAKGVTVAKPQPKDQAILDAACAGETYTKPVLLPWEK